MKFKQEYYTYIIIAIIVIFLLYVVTTFAKSAVKAVKEKVQNESDKAGAIIAGNKRSLTDLEAQEVASRINRYLNPGILSFDQEKEAVQEVKRVKNQLDYTAVKEYYGLKETDTGSKKNLPETLQSELSNEQIEDLNLFFRTNDINEVL